MHHTYTTKGTCSRAIDFDLDENNAVTNIKFTAGCDGNLKSIATLLEGVNAHEIISKLEGITCKSKPTSCGDQLAQGLKQALGENLSHE